MIKKNVLNVNILWININICVFGCRKGIKKKECNRTGWVDKCITYNDKFYLPTDLRDKKECKPCPENCTESLKQ